MRKFFFLSLFIAVTSFLTATNSYESFPLEMGYSILGNSYNGRYIVGSNSIIGWVYDTQTSTMTTLPTNNTKESEEGSAAYAVTSDGTIVVGTFRDMNYTIEVYDYLTQEYVQSPLTIAGYYKDGAWHSLGIGDTELNATNFPGVNWGSYAAAISEDGKIIAGYINTDNYRVPCAWILDSTGEYVYTPYTLPEDNINGNGKVLKLSADGSIAYGVYTAEIYVEYEGEGEYMQYELPLVWTSPNSPKVIGNKEIYSTLYPAISENGKYITFSISDYSNPRGVFYEVESEELSFFTFKQGETPAPTAVTNEGMVSGSSVGGNFMMSTYRPYIYSKELGVLTFYNYVTTYASELVPSLKEKGYEATDQVQAMIAGASADGTIFIGSDNVMSMMGMTISQEGFIITIDETSAIPSNPNRLTFEDLVGNKITENTTIGIFTLAASSSRDMEVDGNSATFSNGETYTARLKTSGTTHSEGRYITVACPSAGTVKIGARTGSTNAINRNIVGTFNGEEVLNKILLEADAEDTEAGKVYPIIEVKIEEAGELKITAPTAALYFYYFEFIEEGDAPEPGPEPTPNPAYASIPMSAQNGNVIAGYSSNGRYLVGTDGTTNVSFLYDTQSEAKTTLYVNDQENSESKAYGVTLDGSIVVGSYRNPDHIIAGTAVHTAGYYKDGNWNALPIPTEYQERLTADYHYSSALAVSDDGNTIVGVINIDDDYPAAWVYNSAQGSYEFVTYQLPANNREGIARLIDISADGSTVVGIYQDPTWAAYPVSWKSPDVPVVVANGEYQADNCKISNNGRYITFNNNNNNNEAWLYNIITGNVQTILFEETPIPDDPFMGVTTNKTMISSVSNDGVIVGYNLSSLTSVGTIGGKYSTKPYVYISATDEVIDFYTYAITKNPELEETLTGSGLSLEESTLFSNLIGINSSSTTYIGLVKGVQTPLGFNTDVVYSEIFALTIDHEPGTGNNVGGTVVDFPFEEDMFINGYSSNGRYVVGTNNDSDTAFLYDAKTEEFTQLTSENGNTKGEAVSKYGTVIAGTFMVNDREMAGYYKDGQWNLLPIPAEAEAGLTQPWYGSKAYSVSDDGSVIGGYVYLDQPSYPGAWYLNEETGEYEYVLFSLPENASVRGRVEAVSGDGTVFYGCYSSGMDNYSIVWTAPDTYTTIQTPSGEEARYLDDYALSNNGKYIAIKTGQGDFGIYNVETAEFNVVELTEQASSFIIKGISDEGIVVGYINYNNSNKPYIYSAELGEMDFQAYLSLLASKLAEETEGNGFSIEDEKYAELHGISANGKRFIGLYNSVEVQSGFWTTINFENAFVITIDGGDNDDVEPEPTPQPEPEAPADPITVDTLFESEYRVSNYSSNANYLVGDAGGYGFVYNIASKQLTQITTVNTSSAKAVSNDGSVVVGTINYNTGSETIVFKNGEYITLSSGNQEGSSITVNGVSDNGNIIVGYVYTTDNQSIPCKWTYNNDTQEYTYSALSIPAGLNGASAHSISADGTVIIGVGNGDIATGIVWQNNTPKVITEGLELLEISSSRISSNGKYAVLNLLQKVEEEYVNLAAIYDVEKDELNSMAFLTDENLKDYPQFEQVTRSAFTGISDTGIAFGQVVLFGGFESEGSTMMLDYAKPYVYHPELGAVSLYEYIQKNNTELLREIIGYGIDMNENLIGTETIGISADGERFITTVSNPLKYVVLDIEYTYEKPGDSIDTESAAKVSIYPNPAINYININGEIVKATLVNVQGQVVLERTENQLSVSSLPQGTYFLKVETADGVFTQKVIIKK